ncbi:MAG: hypothetical protein AAF722_13285 [Cyanobacteria bacterium P01_C01_bin.70]
MAAAGRHYRREISSLRSVIAAERLLRDAGGDGLCPSLQAKYIPASAAEPLSQLEENVAAARAFQALDAEALTDIESRTASAKPPKALRAWLC